MGKTDRGWTRAVRGALIAAALAIGAGATQAAVVTGVVLNGSNGEPVRGATLDFGAGVTATTDLDGVFRLELAGGSYTVTIRREGFTQKRITEVEVADGTVANVSTVLLPAGKPAADGAAASAFSEEITVATEASSSTEEALLAERKNAARISDSIGSLEMSKTTGSDAAGVLKRVTGISLQDGRYVYVRGLGDRYSGTSLNGSKIASTEFERKVVPLDLFSKDLLEKVTVAKSYTADRPGDFAAGTIELTTRDFPLRQAASVGLSLASNSLTTGEPYLAYGSGLSFSGGGGQSLPSSIPDAALSRRSRFTNLGFTPEELEGFGEELIGLWTPQRNSAAPYNRSLNASYGNTMGRLGLLLSVSYDNDFGTRFEEQSIFAARSGGGVKPLNHYAFELGDEKVRQGFTGNVAYRFGDNHHVSFRSLMTEVSTSESRFQEGFFSDLNNDIRNYRVSYLAQEIMSSQLAGKHFLPHLGGGGLLEWRLSASRATTAENRRETLYEESAIGFRLTDNAQSGFMYFNDLNDDLVDARLDWTSLFSGRRLDGSVKAGVAFTRNRRDFDGRRLRFFHRDVRGIDLTLPAEELFTTELIRPNGFEIEEITRPTDTYDGSHDVGAAFVQADLSFARLRLIAGLRVEDSDQEVITLNRLVEGFPPIVSEVKNTDPLPSLNLVYALTDRTNLRLSASQTVNRPEFRELAPFEFIHVVGGFTVAGNPKLQRAKLTSYDVRWEWFPSSGEVLAASLFYKDFIDPIENVLVPGATPRDTFQNVAEAKNLGLELELRKRLGSLAHFLEPFTAIVNYTYVDSEVQLDPATTVLTNVHRPLVGQPDNVLNAILEWSQPRWGSTVRLLYNFVDDKVSRAGGFGLPDVIENGRGTVDLVWQQGLDRWLRGFSIKLSGANLTDEEWLWTQGDGVFRRFVPGRTVSLSASYDF